VFTKNLSLCGKKCNFGEADPGGLGACPQNIIDLIYIIRYWSCFRSNCLTFFRRVCKLEDPRSGLWFWVSRLDMVLVQGDGTHTREFVQYLDRLLRVFEAQGIGGFEIRILPYLMFGIQLQELVQG
jgi:hypothetical protein